MRRRRVERLAELLLQLAAGDQVLDVDLVLDRVGLARRQAAGRCSSDSGRISSSWIAR